MSRSSSLQLAQLCFSRSSVTPSPLTDMKRQRSATLQLPFGVNKFTRQNTQMQCVEDVAEVVPISRLTPRPRPL